MITVILLLLIILRISEYLKCGNSRVRSLYNCCQALAPFKLYRLSPPQITNLGKQSGMTAFLYENFMQLLLKLIQLIVMTINYNSITYSEGCTNERVLDFVPVKVCYVNTCQSYDASNCGEDNQDNVCCQYYQTRKSTIILTLTTSISACFKIYQLKKEHAKIKFDIEFEEYC